MSAELKPSPVTAVTALIVSILLCFAAAGIGSAFTSMSVGTWYRQLAKPQWAPPNWVFGPVWTALYLSMAVAAWLVWRRYGSRGARGPLLLFAAQLVLNAAWSGLFFGLRNPALAFAEILFLLGAVAATALAFGRCSPLAGLLLIPYLLWGMFATALNFAIWRLNA
jgi:tryptophan-rich sensory protein